ITNRAVFRQSAERTIAAFASRLSLVPAALPQMLAACEFLRSEARQIVLIGEKADAGTRDLLRTIYTRFVPHRMVLLVDSDAMRRALSGWIPTIAEMHKLDGRATAYACQDYACQLQIHESEDLARLLSC